MVDRANSATEEAGAVPIQQGSADAKQSPRAYLNSARRALSEDELKSPGAIRLLISESDRLEERCTSLEVVSAAYHDLRVEKAGLESRLKMSKWHEILSGLCLAIGSFGVATGQRLLSIDGALESGIGVMIVSALLVVAGILSKVFK
jgi:hypothetical protein